MKKEQSLKALWKAETDFIDSLVEKYPHVKWGDGSPEISGCPTGWRPVVEDLFAELDALAKNGIDYYESGLVKRLTDGCNRFLDKLRVPRKLRFKRRFAKHRVEKLDIKIEQLKEKFAELRVYYSYNDQRARDHVQGMIDLAERICSHTCQASGADGKLRTDGWWVVLSDEEYLKRKKKKYGKA